MSNTAPSTSVFSWEPRGAKRPHPSTSQRAGAFIPCSPPEESNKKLKARPLACRECRRLKVRCDRVFPCESCRKRGCEEICPDGALETGRGSRFILANTAHLHGKILHMGSRIRQLEDALEKVQGSTSTEPHPLLSRENKIAWTMSSEARSNQFHHENGDAHGEVDQLVDDEVHIPHLEHSHHDHDRFGLANELLRLSQTFPMPVVIPGEPDLDTRRKIHSRLPTREQALYLWDQARTNALWQLNPHSDDTFVPNLLDHVYSSPVEEISPHRLALLLMVLAVGRHMDLKPRYDLPEADIYHTLSRAALSEISIMENPTTETVITLFYMTWFLSSFCQKEKADGYAWALLGITVKLAQSIGLHRDGSRSKVIPEEDEKRRAIFWEVLYLDSRLSLSLGRPPSLLSMTHADCKQPTYAPSRTPRYFQEWRHKFYLKCVEPCLSLLSTLSPDYGKIIELDNDIRNFEIPGIPPCAGPLERWYAVQVAAMILCRETLLVQVHRTYFARTMNDVSGFSRSHQFAPSVVAIFSCACQTISTMEDVYRQEPSLLIRYACAWKNLSSAAVALGLIISRAPHTPLAPSALHELRKAVALANEAKREFPDGIRASYVMSTLLHEAGQAYTQWKLDQDSMPPSDSESVDESHSGRDDDVSQGDPFENAHPTLRQYVENGEWGPKPLPSGSRSIRPRHLDGVDGPSRAPMNFSFGALDSSWNGQSWMPWL